MVQLPEDASGLRAPERPWCRHARRRGGSVFFELHGRSAPDDGRGIHVLTFETDVGGVDWLNECVAVGEGAIDPERLLLVMRYYECTVDYLPALAGSR